MSRAEDRSDATADTTLDEFLQEDERPNWTPHSDDQHDTNARVKCRTCGHSVSEHYARVFGSNDGDVFACRECSTDREVAKGAAARDPR